MKFAALPLEGAYEIQLEKHADARGFFSRIYCNDEFASQRLNTNWVQMNLSMSTQTGTLRGMHFQRDPAAEIKLVRCLRGKALDVIIDLRSASATYGQSALVTLDPDKGNAVYIPKGFAHGFQTLAPVTELQYMHSVTYAPGHEGGVNPLDPDLGISWPLPVANLSERDRALPLLKDCQPL